MLPLAPPPFRQLRVYAVDPSLDISLDLAGLNEVTLHVPWERDPETGRSSLEPGPVGEYLEVVDFDPASECFYAPVDLDDPFLLAQDGLAPGEGDPRFHQQMVYAVAMKTIRNFETALGRVAFWAPRQRFRRRQHEARGDEPSSDRDEFVQRLRIYPHALRESNAYYSPAKISLLFGYFPATSHNVRHLPGGIVFTSLSHDVIAHETTHALIDGLHDRFDDPTNEDVLAFHEAFADIVAIFQHFSLGEMLRNQIARTRGDLANENLLAKLALEFGQAASPGGGALRDALGEVDDDGVWRRATPDPAMIQGTFEPHARGSLLVAAVFDAFISIYRARTQDIIRIATEGSGVLPAGQLHPDLVNRLAEQAAKAAQHVLSMCIRALDYCPPVDLTFGDYLRALITADYDLVRNDDRGYRIAMVEAFRHRGIYPRDVRSLSPSSLLWSGPSATLRGELGRAVGTPSSRGFSLLQRIAAEWTLSRTRAQLYRRAQDWQAVLHGRLRPILARCARDLGLDQRLKFEIHSARPAQRVSPKGEISSDIVIEITQRRAAYLDPKQTAGPPDFWFRGGCTLLVDLRSGDVRYSVSKRITSEGRLERQRKYLRGETETSLHALYFGSSPINWPPEPFALLHRRGYEESS